jgi:hypothetical protein
MPVLQQRLLAVHGDPFSFVSFDLQLAVSADVGEMRSNRTAIPSPSGDLDHDFRGTPHRASDLLNLCAGEPIAVSRAHTAATKNVQ